MRLACILRTLLGLEAIIKFVLMIYTTTITNSELLISLYKIMLDKSIQLASSVLARKVPRYAELRALYMYHCLFLWELWTGGFKDEALDISNFSIGSFRWRTE